MELLQRRLHDDAGDLSAGAVAEQNHPLQIHVERLRMLAHVLGDRGVGSPLLDSHSSRWRRWDV